MVKWELQGAVRQTTYFSHVSLLDRSFFCNLSSLFFSHRTYSHQHYLCMSQLTPRARQSSPHFSELGKDVTPLVNLKRAVCGRNCRKKAFSPPSSSHPTRGCCCSPTFSQALFPLDFHGVKEAPRSLGFTCLWGKGRAALREESFSLLPALWLALQSMGEGFCSSNFAGF